MLRLAKPEEAYFWATHQGAELDLLMLKGHQRVGVEFKRADVPKLTPSMRIAMHDLKLDALYIVYPGAPFHFDRWGGGGALVGTHAGSVATRCRSGLGCQRKFSPPKPAPAASEHRRTPL